MIIVQMIAATIVHVDAIYGARIVVVNVWDYFKNGVKHLNFHHRHQRRNISTLER